MYVVKLKASDAKRNDRFGVSVSLDGNTALIGAYLADAVYVFERESESSKDWQQIAKLLAPASSFEFGISVSLSNSTALIGAQSSLDSTKSGYAFIFERDTGGQGNWGQVARLKAEDAQEFDYFGSPVSLSDSTALVGAHRDGDGGIESGSAYIFERDAGGEGNWGQVAKLTAADATANDNFGISVSLDGVTALIGAYRDGDGGINSGSAYIFERGTEEVGDWTQIAKLTANDAARSDLFGASVSINGAIVLVGALGDDQLRGSVYVFDRDSGITGAWGQVAKLTAADATRSAYFGYSVSVDGTTALVGAREDDDRGVGAGSAYVFDIDPPEIGEDSLVARWPLDDAVGSVATDTSDNTLDGILVEEPAWSLGQDAGALTFDGSEDYVQVPASALLDLEDGLTLAAWVRPIPAAGAIQQILSKDNAYEFEIGNSLNPAAYSLRLNNIVAGAGTTPVEEGVWQHLAVTWDGTTVRYFYNGLEDGTATFNGPLDVTASDLGLGARPAPAIEGGPTFFLDGSLDDVRLFGSALSAEEIAEIVECTLSDIDPPVVTDRAPNSILSAGTASTALQLTTDTAAECRYTDGTDTTFASMAPFETTGGTDHSSTVSGLADDTLYTFAVRCQDTAGNTSSVDTVLFGIGHSDLTSGLVSHWSLDDATGCIAADGVGGNSLTLGPACPTDAPSFVDGVSGTGLDFTAAGHEVSVASPSGTSGVTALTLSAWVRHPSTAGNFRALIDQRDSGADGFDLYLDPGSRLFARFNSATATGSSTVADGIWHHVVAVYDGASTKLYVDGELEANVATSAGGIDTTAALFLGHHFASDDYTAQGQLDEVRIFDRALSTLEVVGLYLADR